MNLYYACLYNVSISISFLDTFRTRGINISFDQMENGVYNVSFTCYFAPCTEINGKCFIDFVDGSRNFIIEAKNPTDLNATHAIEISDGSEYMYRIYVHDVLPNQTVLKEAVLHTSFSMPLPSSASHTRSTGKH